MPLMPDISVLLPFYNAADTLPAALDSVLAQQGPTFEVLAIDDGSDDNSADIVHDIAARDPRLRLIRSDGAGIASALMAGLQKTRAAYIARMDSDDLCLPNRFARQFDMLKKDESLGAVGVQVEAFPRQAVGEGLKQYVEWQNALITPQDHLLDLFVEAPLCHPSVMMRRSALLTVGGYRSGNFPEDYDLWLRLVEKGFRLAKVPHPLFRWRQRPGRMTFSDPRFSRSNFRKLKAEYLARRLREEQRDITIWGAGPNGKRLSRARNITAFKPITLWTSTPPRSGDALELLRFVLLVFSTRDPIL